MSGFIIDEEGPPGLFAVFEDDGNTGYLYVYDNNLIDKNKIITHLHIYNCSKELNVKESDIKLIWSKDGAKCGIIIWGGMRGIIDFKNNYKYSLPLHDRTTKPISDDKYLHGFESYQFF